MNTSNNHAKSLGRTIWIAFISVLAVILIGAFFIFPGVKHEEGRFFHILAKNLESHLGRQMELIGVPPNPEIAKQVVNDLGFVLQIHGPDQDTQLFMPHYLPEQPELLTLEIINQETDKIVAGAKVGRFRGQPFVAFQKRDYIFVFTLPARDPIHSMFRLLIGLFFVSLILMAVFHFLVRRALRPLNSLVEVSQELSAGNLSARMMVRGQREFNRIAVAFNQMADSLQNQMKAKEILLLNVSHELRSPLGRLKMASEFVTQESTRKSIQEDIVEMEVMIDELLESYRLRDGNGSLLRQRVELNSWLEQVVHKYQQPGVEIHFPSAATVYVEIDEARMLKAIGNLLQNAIKYSKPPKTEIEIGISELGNEIEIQIKDHGIGIESDKLVKIFEPFYRADVVRSAGGGYGLGLSLVKSIVEAHSGSVTVESVLGLGTSFRLRLPRA